MTNKARDYSYSSFLSSIFNGYVEEMRAVGYKFDKGASDLKRLDNLLIQEGVCERILTKELVLLWTKKRQGESDRTCHRRISLIRGLAKYMTRLGYKAYIFPDKATTMDKHQYTPYIFSVVELAKIFDATDKFPRSSVSSNRHLILPLLFRMLYGCGLRVSEALDLKIVDVNLKDGTLFIHQAKLGKERVVPMAQSLIDRCKCYSRELHTIHTDNPYYFPSPYGGQYNDATIYNYFRVFLWQAGISHGGRGQGPRVHDFRHTHSVHCLKKWVLNGNDLTVLLPYLSAYLGHVDLRSSQYYLRLTADLYPAILTSVEAYFSNLIPEVKADETN